MPFFDCTHQIFKDLKTKLVFPVCTATYVQCVGGKVTVLLHIEL